MPQVFFEDAVTERVSEAQLQPCGLYVLGGIVGADEVFLTNEGVQ